MMVPRNWEMGTHCLIGMKFQLCKRQGDLSHSNVNVLNATELYIDSNFMCVFTAIFKTIYGKFLSLPSIPRIVLFIEILW